MRKAESLGRIAIFTEDPGWHGNQLKLAFANLGYSSDFVSLTECCFNIGSSSIPILIPGFEQGLPDAVFVRGVPGGSLEEVVLYLDILHALKVMSVPVYNEGQVIERSVDKGMTSFLLQQAGIPTPLTWILRNRTDALSIAENELKNGHMLISKPLFGSQGEGIRRLEKMTDLLWLNSSHGVYYLQRYVHCSGSGFSDKRVFVVSGRVIAAMVRRGKSWLNNVAQGASCEKIEIDTEMSDLAIKAASALSMDYAGVDLIHDRATGQHVVIEINSIPAWKGLESVCKFNIAELLAKDLIEKHSRKYNKFHL